MFTIQTELSLLHVELVRPTAIEFDGNYTLTHLWESVIPIRLQALGFGQHLAL